jgi:2-polyprenyl-3-methyl-5-hydroxy-6-metoxy-1,4-benzoquinol methylase
MGKIKGAFAGSYDRFVKRQTALPDGLLELIRSFTPESIVEFACGTGTVSIGLALAGFDVVAVDYSPDMLRSARRKAREHRANLKIVKADILEVDLKRRFDLLLCLGNTIPHFTTAAQLNRFLKNCVRHLRPDAGILIFQQLNYDRILRDRPRTFAVDIDSDLIRFKQYRYRKNLIDFVVTIADGAIIPPAISVSTVTLKPWTKKELDRATKAVGFDKSAFYSDYKKGSFSNDSKDLILVGTTGV